MPEFRFTPATGRRLNWSLWGLLAVTNVVDLLASQRAFAAGIGELNPLVDRLVGSAGIWSLGLVKLFFLAVLLVLLPYIRGWTRGLLAIACLAYVALTLVHVVYLPPPV